jgi:outer membrane receptor protein involved in Fe transport
MKGKDRPQINKIRERHMLEIPPAAILGRPNPAEARVSPVRLRAVSVPTSPDTPFYGTINLVERQFALFGEATYSSLPRLGLTLGARYFDFKDDFDPYFTGVAGAIASGEPDTGSGEQSSKGVNPRAVLTFKVDDQVIVYGEARAVFATAG